jgi:hypothetical protein
MNKEIYYDKGYIEKNLKRFTLLFAVGLAIWIVFYFTKTMPVEVLIPLAGLQFVFLGYFYLLTKKKLDFERPVLILFPDHMELSDFNFFFVLKTKTINYHEIKSIGMDTKNERNSSRTYLSINLITGKEIKYDIQQLGMDSTMLAKGINEVNPSVKIVNYGSFEFK